MLILPIKKQWYDMILSGIKKEEYREIKPYYSSRFSKILGSIEWESVYIDYNESGTFIVKFRNGYSSNSPSFIARVNLRIGKGNPEWGAEPNTNYYILRINHIEV